MSSKRLQSKRSRRSAAVVQKTRAKTNSKDRKKRRKARKVSYAVYILRVLNQVHHDANLSISTRAMAMIHSYIEDIFERLVDEAKRLSNHAKHSTVVTRDFSAVAQLVLPGKLAKHALGEGSRWVFICSSGKESASGEERTPTVEDDGHGLQKPSDVTKRRSRSSRAGLQFSIARFHRLFRCRTRKRVASKAATYFTAIIEYLVAELLELAGNAARDNQSQRITPRHIMHAIRLDDQLDKLFKDVTTASHRVSFH